MTFTKPLLIGLAALLLSACASQSTKKQNSNEPVVYKQFSYELIKKSPVPASEFGPNPYVNQQSAPIPEAALKEFRYAVAALKGGNTDLAEQQLKELIKGYPTFSGPAYNLALLKHQQGDSKAAKEYLDMALQRNAHNLDALNLKAVMLREDGDFAGAKQIYLDILKGWGGYLPAYRNLGILNDLYEGHLDEALVYYKQYNAMLDHQDNQVYGWIVDLQRRLGIHPNQQPAPQAQQAAPEQAAPASEEAKP